MASIIDAIEETVHDDHAIFKFIIWAIPVVVSYLLFYVGNMGCFYFVGSLTVLMLLTIIVKTINNCRNGRNEVLPSISIFAFTGTSIKILFALGPTFAVCLWCGFKLSAIPILIPLPNIQIIYSTLVWLLLSSIMVTTLILFSKTEKIKDAYDFRLIQKSCIDILFAVIYFVPQILLFNLIIVGVVAYIFFVLRIAPYNIYTIIIAAISLVTSAAITGNYFAQIDYEQVARDEDND